jgi:hypothetical protein
MTILLAIIIPLIKLTIQIMKKHSLKNKTIFRVLKIIYLNQINKINIILIIIFHRFKNL